MKEKMASTEPNRVKDKKINLTEASRQYFTEIESQENDKKFYKCNECNTKINGTYPSNLTSHLKKKHNDIFAKLSENKSIEEKRNKILMGCVEFVAVDGNPFSKIHGSGFLSLIEDTLKELNEAGRAINLSDSRLSEVKDILCQTAEQIQQEIREELHNRPFSLMVDITTKRRRSILGVSAQFVCGGKHKIRSIGMLQLTEAHTGEYLARVIGELLCEYGVKPQQIISVTTDNGANVLKMVRDMTAQLVDFENNHQNQMQRECDEVMDPHDEEIHNYLETVPDYSDVEALNILFDQSDSEEEVDSVLPEEQENLLNAMVSNLQIQNGPIWDVRGIRCAAHTLQLCIKYALDKLSNANKNVIALCRRIAKNLRLKSSIHELRGAGIIYSTPHLDVETRWCSTYVMVKIFSSPFYYELIY